MSGICVLVVSLWCVLVSIVVPQWKLTGVEMIEDKIMFRRVNYGEIIKGIAYDVTITENLMTGEFVQIKVPVGMKKESWEDSI